MGTAAIQPVDRRLRSSPVARRSAVLFEVLLAVALFAGAAAFALGCVKSVFAALDRSRREQEAVDLARSKMGELEAGMITLTDLRGQPVDAIGSTTSASSANQASLNAKPRWIAEVKTQRSEFTGLSLVELTVREDPSGAGVSEDDAMSFTLRQLMTLRKGEADEYESDPLIEGLPKTSEPVNSDRAGKGGSDARENRRAPSGGGGATNP